MEAAMVIYYMKSYDDEIGDGDMTVSDSLRDRRKQRQNERGQTTL